VRRWWLVLIAACGGSSATSPDAPSIVDAPPNQDSLPQGNPGFAPPTSLITAWTFTGGAYQPATLDLSCEGMVASHPATTIAISLATTVIDFQNQSPDAGMPVAAFAGVATTTTIASGTTDGSGVATLTIPKPQTRIGFVVTGGASAHDTYTFDRVLAPSTATQTITVPSVSDSTFDTLPSLVNLNAAVGSATDIGTARDCQGHLLAGLAATVSATPGVRDHIAGADTFYFQDPTDLPVTHETTLMTTHDGIFMVIEMSATPTAYVQLWGFRDANQLANGTMELISELPVVVPANAALVTDQDPHQVP
jgi:hypothetical protein